MKEKDAALGVLEKALDAARSIGCDAADALLHSGSTALTRFANNAIHQNVARESQTLVLRVVRGQRVSVVRTGVLSERAIRDAAHKAAEIAASAAEDPEFPGVLAVPRAEPCAIFDAETAAATPSQRSELASCIIRVIEKGRAVAAGSICTAASTIAAASTAGTRQFERSTQAALNVVAMAGTAAGCAEFSGARLSEIDATERAEFALRKCLDSRDATEIEPGEYAVVLEPPAVAEMLMFLGWLGFGAMEMQQGRSCLQGRLGTKVCDEQITIVDNARDPAGLPSSFDGEGVPKRRIVLIEEGVFRNVVYDQRTAAKDGVQSTGHGSMPPNPYGPHPSNVLLLPGGTTIEEMISSTARGLLVSSFHYTNIAEPSTCTITGMTRYGLFEIVAGKVSRPVRNLRFTQSVLDALNHVELVGRERQRFGGTVVPALKIRRFRFTGISDH